MYVNGFLLRGAGVIDGTLGTGGGAIKQMKK